MSLHYLVKPEMLIGHVLPLSCYRKKLQNLSHLIFAAKLPKVRNQLDGDLNCSVGSFLLR